LSTRKFLVVIATTAATVLIAAPAQAAPTAKDARAAGAKAMHALAGSLAAARSGRTDDAIAGISRARHLQARAARIARRAGAGRSPATRAKLLRGAATGVDDAFDSYAELLPEVPPELQPYVAAALEQFGALRTELVTQLTSFVETLPPDVREQVLAAIAAFSSDGDLEALIAALSDPNVSAAVQAQIQELVTSLTASLSEQVTSFEGLEALLPPGALAQLQVAMTQIQSQLESALAQLAEILSPQGTPELPGLPPDLCGELQALLESMGLPVPPGLCPA
jgi:hypothetical protein